MRLRLVPIPVFLTVLLVTPALAGQPDGPVGRLIPSTFVTISNGSGLPDVTCTGFQWGQAVGPVSLDPAETVTLDFAIIPFSKSHTTIQTDFAIILFENGAVKGIPYNRSTWNDVAIRYRPATQDYVLTVNGVSAGPFPFDDTCSYYGCSSVSFFRITGALFDEDSEAWIDSVTMTRETALGPETIYSLDFSVCGGLGNLIGGVVVSAQPKGPQPKK